MTDNNDNPFLAPQARVADADAKGEDDFIPEGRRVSAGRGAAWFGHGWDLFRAAPGTWIGITLTFMVLVMILSMIPLLNILVNLAMPVFVGGIMLGCKSLEQGKGLRFDHLFAGFSHQFGNLALVGLLYMLGVAAAMLLIFLVVTLIGIRGAMFGELTDIIGMDVGLLMVALLTSLLVGLLVIVPLAMAVWYAPALVVFHQVPPLAAMKSSFFMGIKNFLPFLIYGLLFMLLSIIATIPLLLGWLVLTPMIFGSVYASYKDIYTTGGA